MAMGDHHTETTDAGNTPPDEARVPIPPALRVGEIKTIPTSVSAEGTPVYPNTTQLPRIRTYAADLSEEIRKKGATLSTIVGAERERSARELSIDQGVDEEREGKKKRAPWLVVSALALVGLGVVAVIVAYIFIPRTETIITDSSIIFANKRLEVQPDERTPFAEVLGRERFASNLSLGEIQHLTVGTTSAQEILALLQAPESLQREARAIMIGLHAFDRNQPLIIIEVAQFDRAYGAMLTWEPNMARSLGSFFRPLNGDKAGTTTIFNDVVVKNIDVRRSQAAWPIMYAFPRRDLLIITTNESTIAEVLSRLIARPLPAAKESAGI